MKRTLKILALVTGLVAGTGSPSIANAAEDAGAIIVSDANTVDARVAAPDDMVPVVTPPTPVVTPPTPVVTPPIPVPAPDNAVTVPENADEAVGLMTTIAGKLRMSEWLPAFALSLLLIIYGLRLWVFRRIDWFQTKTGGTTLAFGTSFILTGVTLYLGGDALSFGMVTTAAAVAWAAAGKHGHAKDVAES